MKYIEKYGVEMVKKHLRNRFSGRYFKMCIGYANDGITLFEYNLFLRDIGANLDTFPLQKKEQEGWNLYVPPTDEELDKFLTKT